MSTRTSSSPSPGGAFRSGGPSRTRSLSTGHRRREDVGAPGNPEYANGAVASDGSVWRNEEAFRRAGGDEMYVERKREEDAALVRTRRCSCLPLLNTDRYRPVCTRSSVLALEGSDPT
jgi:hypothetical protein